jgi:UDP-N-acetylglucosamine 4,6-dehydratase
MCPADDSHLTLKFDDHYVLRPTITFGFDVDYTSNKLGETGKPVELGFEYNSGNNTDWLTHEQFLDMAREYL